MALPGINLVRFMLKGRGNAAGETRPRYLPSTTLSKRASRPTSCGMRLEGDRTLG